MRRLGPIISAADHYVVKVPQRMCSQVVIGLVLIVGSHWSRELEERTWLRDAGAAIIAFAVTRWLAQQGRRRERPDGMPVRNPTLRFKIPRDDK